MGGPFSRKGAQERGPPKKIIELPKSNSRKNTNTEKKEEEDNCDSKRLQLLKYEAAVISILSSAMLLNSLFQ